MQLRVSAKVKHRKRRIEGVKEMQTMSVWEAMEEIHVSEAVDLKI